MKSGSFMRSVAGVVSGIMASATATAAGAAMMEAVNSCASGLAILPSRNAPYTTSTLPAMVAKPAVIMISSSDRVIPLI